jgi:LemA protein
MDSSAITGLAFFLFVVGVLIYTVILYNGLVRLRNENDRAWANIGVLLKQRHDEIPNLVETVKGYMQHEQQTLLAVTQARTASIGAASIGQKAVADLQVTSALRGLFAVAENYPQLKANQNFLKLQTRITELEERIADRREFFNDDVNTYNTRIGQIPDVFVASFMSLKPREMFKVSDEDRKLVDVKFASSQGLVSSLTSPSDAESQGNHRTVTCKSSLQNGVRTLVTSPSRDSATKLQRGGLLHL